MYHDTTSLLATRSLSHKDEEALKIDSWTVWAIGVGSAMGGVFFGWEFVLYGGFISGLFAVMYAASFYFLYARIITELSVRYQSSGGSFDFVMDALGIKPAIVVAIMNMLKLICANAATALAISSYMMQAGLPSHYKFIIWVGIYGIFTLLDCIGIKQSSFAQVFATLLCIAIVVFYAGSNFTMFKSSYLVTIPEGSSKISSIYLFFKGLPFAVQFFDGFEEIPLLYSYTRNAEQTLPSAINSCYFTVLLIALGVLISAAGSANADELLNSDAPLMVGIDNVYGSGSVVSDVVAYLIVVGLLTNFFAFVVYSSQQIQAIAEANLLPRVLAYREVKYGAPVVASICSMVIGLVVTSLFEILLGEEQAQNTLLMASIFPSMVCYLLVLQCIIQIRRIEEKGQKSFGLFTARELRALGNTIALQFYVSHAIFRSRVAQSMVVVLMIALIMMASRSFDYIYGLLVFGVVAIMMYLLMIRRARNDLREEQKTIQREQEHLSQVLIMKQQGGQHQQQPGAGRGHIHTTLSGIGIGRSILEGHDDGDVVYTQSTSSSHKNYASISKIIPTAAIIASTEDLVDMSVLAPEDGELVLPTRLLPMNDDDDDDDDDDELDEEVDGDDDEAIAFQENRPFLTSSTISSKAKSQSSNPRKYQQQHHSSHHRRRSHHQVDEDTFQHTVEDDSSSYVYSADEDYDKDFNGDDHPDTDGIDDSQSGDHANNIFLGWFFGANTSSASPEGRNSYQTIR